VVVGDPSAPGFSVENIGLTPGTETRFEDCADLLEKMDKLRRDVDASGVMGAMDRSASAPLECSPRHRCSARSTVAENPEEKLNWRVEKMRLTKDKTALVYNDFLTFAGIPEAAFAYRLGNRSALE